MTPSTQMLQRKTIKVRTSFSFFVVHREDSDSATRGLEQDEDSMRTDAAAEVDQGSDCILLFSIPFELIL